MTLEKSCFICSTITGRAEKRRGWKEFRELARIRFFFVLLRWNLAVNHVFEGRGPGSRTKDSNYPGITCATLFIPVLLHTAVICIFQSDYREIPRSLVLFTSLLISLSLSLSFIFTFIPERVNGCIRVILSHLTLRLPSLRMENNTRPGVDPSFSNSEHASLPLIRAFCRYARERIWGDGGSVLSCPREEWNSKIVKYFAVREIEAKTVDSAFLCILKNIQDVCVVVSSPDCCHLSSSSWINFVERVDKFRGAK